MSRLSCFIIPGLVLFMFMPFSKNNRHTASKLPLRSLARSGLKDFIQISTPEELTSTHSKGFSSKDYVNGFFR